MKNNSHQDLVSNQRNVYNVIYETNYRTWRKSYMDLTKLTAYEIIEHRPLPDLKSEGALLRHKKSGARVLLISNDDENKVDVMERIAPFFRPEFLNRFNAVIEFNQLSKEDLKKIVDLMLDQVNKTLAKKDITLDVTDAAKELLMEQGYDKTMGARPLRRVVETEIRDNVTDFYLDNIDVKHLLADVKDGHIVISEKADSDDSKDQDKAEK